MVGQTEEAATLLNRFAEIMARLTIDHHQQQVTALDLTLAQAQVLRILRRGPLPTGQLAVELRVSPSSVTQLTDRLIRKQLLQRQSVAGDRRCVLVAVSAKGKRLIDDFRRRRSLVFQEALAQLNAKEQQHILAAMKMVVETLDRYEEVTRSDQGTPGPAEVRSGSGKLFQRSSKRKEGKKS
jgi:DNA-binding MarR family transcriptional regulator